MSCPKSNTYLIPEIDACPMLEQQIYDIEMSLGSCMVQSSIFGLHTTDENR